jgi:flagellar basal-body rod protein FlgB
MIGRLDSEFGFLSNALSLRANRQQMLASNIANADTPNYKAVDFDFSEALKHAQGAGEARGTLAATDARHLQPKGGNAFGAKTLYRVPMQPSIDGNTVDMDVERSQFTENAIHYQFMVDRVTGKVKNLLSAIQGQ